LTPLVTHAQISLGDVRSYFLSTAKNELGVVLARSAAGHDMVPINWQQMQCPVTKLKEFRKVGALTAPRLHRAMYSALPMCGLIS